jgi:murein peptide amidase A
MRSPAVRTAAAASIVAVAAMGARLAAGSSGVAPGAASTRSQPASLVANGSRNGRARPDGQSSLAHTRMRQRLRRALALGSDTTTRRAHALLGRSARGRPISIRGWSGFESSNRVLVFGCIHGTECAGLKAVHDVDLSGCPPYSTILAVPNLNPDGFALGTRLNGRGVDLNRNFPSQWRSIGQRYDLEYSGPRPFSEPESRLAARLIRLTRPRITIWFHQEAKAMVRAWGPSLAAGRRFARLAHLPFRHLPWLVGTAPNWQNHRFPHTASFVVELPPGLLDRRDAERYGQAIFDLSRMAANWGAR